MTEVKGSVLACSFCSKPAEDLEILIAGVTGNICGECIAASVGVMATALNRRSRMFYMRPEEVGTLADANPNPNTPSTVKELPHG